MQITMMQSMMGAASQAGNTSMEYTEGQTYDMTMPWQIELAQVFIANGWAKTKGRKKQTKVVAPTEAKVRARNEDGTLKADDPSTTDVNEAWEDAKPKRKSRKTSSK